MNFAMAVAWLVILAGSWLGWQLLRQNGRLLLRLEELEKRLDELEFGEAGRPEGLPVGSEAPSFELPDLAGQSKSLAQFRGQPVLLIFFNPDCGFCRDLMPKLAAYLSEGPASRVPDMVRPITIILTTGDAEKNRQFFAEHRIGCPVLLQNDGEVAKAYQAHGTPTGYLVNTDGKIASGLAIGAEALLKLASQSVPLTPTLSPSEGESETLGGDGRANRFGNRSLAHSKIKRDGLKAGTPAPDFRLPRLDGRGDLTLSELRGKPVLLVFSSPGCGPCNTLAPELEKLHRALPDLEVLMVSKGEPEENRAKVKEHRLTFPVLLQQQWEISRRYAMFATPVAYLIDDQGIIADDVAVGADAVLDLMARAERSPEKMRQTVAA